MSNIAKVYALIEKAFVSAIGRLPQAGTGSLMSNLNVQVDSENGEMQIYDDGGNVLEKLVVFDWIKRKEEEAKYNQRVAGTLKMILAALSTKKAFDNPCFMKPFSINLTDDNFAVIEELFFLDEDLLKSEAPLLKDLDVELDIFLEKLLSDVK